ncbi:bifunctional [glutamate--ammonia ligase]-adenylyl-L-tyrosine phosphorylase/[glutamate--ammonia-ligase] adenylyltransferase [Aliikangiella sp. IMCC44359]|uniref:bifunctional [glutamate--ammonia ligase]-adenylyl-L-tyrosine phosphorylase/[glutamate--ammonia-ligase] adenylyltransferase n=1 Tax=Aliikangiella sp. IMCC44359 TaxID=3459125 RepID=UPI00403AA322
MDSNLPNSNWQAAKTYMQTSLSEDLFQLVLEISPISRFVEGVFNSQTQLACDMLTWHVANSDKIVGSTIDAQFAQFIVKSCDNEAELMRDLRLFRKAHSAAIAVLELGGRISIESSSLRISILADCLIKAAYQWAYSEHQARFGAPLNSEGHPQDLLIVGMGKLGGMELNFSSDIDLIFFYPAEGETQNGPKRIENSRFFRRLSTQLIRLLDEVTESGFVFRVDMRLRPYGDSGALAMSLAQAEEYYQEQGRGWERFAMIRARVLTGGHEDQQVLNDIIRSFSFRRYIDYGVIESIRTMKEMIQREVRRKGLKDNIKLGAGGIREVEFIVQSLQLIQGGRDKRLQEKNTLKVLPFLVESQLLPKETADSLHSAYRFLRRLEHCIQELAEKQTQQLPQELSDQNSLCKALKFSSWLSLKETLDKYQKDVNQHFNDLLGEQRSQALTQDDFYQSLAEGHIEPEQLLEKTDKDRKEPLSLEVAQSFVHLIAQFLSDSAVIGLSSRGAKRLKTFFPALLAACLSADLPELTLSRLLTVLHAVLKRTAYLELLSENPPILQHLVDLAGRSEWVVKRISAYPILFDELLYPSSLYEPLQKADLSSELQQILLRVDENDEEELLDTVRSFKQINELRVAAALLAERLSISQVSRYLTQIAEVVLQAAVKICWNLLKKKYGVPESLEFSEQLGFAVIGYGKLGGAELGFGSDLDLVFLFNQSVDESTNGPRALNNSRFYTRFAQKLIHFLSTRTNLGLLYEVDMRLRPSGSSGLLVGHIDAYRDYQMESAWTWEHQALVRARFVAGDPAVQAEYDEIRQKVMKLPRDTEKLKHDVISMRAKMRQQLETKQSKLIDLKQVAGGLVDIEFLAQYFALAYIGDKTVPSNMVDCLKLAQQEKILLVQEGSTLIKCYRLFRNRMNELALLSSLSLVDQSEFKKEREQVSQIWKKYLSE